MRRPIENSRRTTTEESEMVMQEYATAPERSLDQRMDALAKANVVRTHRARLKRELKAGRLTLSDLMLDEQCETMKVFDALLCVPKYGRVKANRVLSTCRISPSKTFGGMTDRQRYEMLAMLPGHARALRERLAREARAA